jgi:soluble lytic murein transglycosylase-like protein
MPRARLQDQDDWQTAAASDNGSGCYSFYILAPLATLVIAGFLVFISLKSPLAPAAVPVDNAAAPNPAGVVTPIWSSANASTTASGLSPIFTKEIQHWGSEIIRWANAAAVDPNLAATVMQIESCGDPRATSRSGAMGLFQVMPFHFRFGENPYHPDTNALRGLNYLARSLTTGSGDPRLALAGYNGGIGVIARSEWAWPSETKRYVLYGAPIYEDAHSGAISSASLTEWYQKYGASLCRQAAQRLGIP